MKALHYLLRHWRGQLRLPLAFWVNGLPALFGLLLVTRLSPTLPGSWSERPGAMRFVSCVAVTGMLVNVTMHVWANVGIWRSAARSAERGGRPVWARTAQAFVLALVAVDVFAVVHGLRTGGFAPLMIAFGHDPHGRTAIQLSPDGKTARVSGLLAYRFAEDFRSTLQTSPSLQTVQMTSFGGRMYEAIPAARALRAAGLDTRAVGPCYSGCAILFMSGRARSLAEGAQLLFHPPDAPGLNDTQREDSMEVMLTYLRSVGASPALIARVGSLHVGEVWVPTQAELVDYQIVTRPSAQAP